MPTPLFLEILTYDLRYAMRGLRRNHGFALTAILAIALGTGVSTAVFSVVDRILFRRLPYTQDERLVSVGMTAPIAQQEFLLGSDYMEWRERQAPFASMATLTGVDDCDLTDKNPERIRCARVESNLLSTLGVAPLLGRNFTADEDRPNAPRVALLSHGLWKSRFAADPAIVGKTMPIDGRATTIVGVLPAGFELPTLDTAQILIPQALDPANQRRPNVGRVLATFARLKPGVTIAQAEAALQPLFNESLNFVPPRFRKEVKLRVRSLRDRQVHDARLASWILLGSVLAVLLIACANVANLLLARASGRQREIAVRSALGANRLRLARQTLTESLLLGLIGGIAGFSVAWLLLQVFVSIAPQGMPFLNNAALDFHVLGFTLAASLVSGILFGLAPALQSPRLEMLGSGHTIASSRSIFRQILVAGQIAVSLVLLTCAGMLLRSLWKLQDVQLGMRVQQVSTATVVLGQQLYPDPTQRFNFFEKLEARLHGIPGTVAISDSLPLGPSRSTLYGTIQVEGHEPVQAQGTGGNVVWRLVTPDYFHALDIPIIRGRGFREEDRSSGDNVLIISDSLDRRMFPNEDPIGKRVLLNLAPPWFTIIGVAGDVRNTALSSAADPEYYFVRRHVADYGLGNRALGSRAASVVVRSPLDQRPVQDWLRKEIAAIDPTVPVQIAPMSLQVSKLEQTPRFNAILLSLFAAAGLLLSTIGLYGVIAFLVSERTREIGVRMALGATPARIMKAILGQAARWAVAGMTVGAAGSFFAARLLRTLLFEVQVNDDRSLAMAMALLFAVTLLASAIPSRRASRIDPLLALRQE